MRGNERANGMDEVKLLPNSVFYKVTKNYSYDYDYG